MGIKATCSPGSDPLKMQPGCQRVGAALSLRYETVLDKWKKRKAVWNQHPQWELLCDRLLWGDN